MINYTVILYLEQNFPIVNEHATTETSPIRLRERARLSPMSTYYLSSSSYIYNGN